MLRRTKWDSRLVMGLMAAATCAAPAFATTLFQDDFESYADTAAMQAVWGSAGAGSLDTSLAGANVKSMTHPGGTVNTHTFNPGNLLPTDIRPIVWQFDYYWDGNDNKRTTGGLRDDGGGAELNSILEMGYYNASGDNEDEGFSYRTVFIPGATNWQLFTGADGVTPLSLAGQAATWSTFRAVIKGSSITFTVDLGRDGTIDSTATVAADSSVIAYNSARFGGPSSLSSAGGPADFDNLSITRGLLGDVNGNNKIDNDDYAAIDRGFAKGLTGAANGDFNFDNVVDASDYLVIDTSLAAQGGGLSPAFLAAREAEFGSAYVTSLVAAVPEPSVIGLVGLSVVAGFKRRRR